MQMQTDKKKGDKKKFLFFVLLSPFKVGVWGVFI